MSIIRHLLHWLRLKLRPDEIPDRRDIGLGHGQVAEWSEQESLMPGGTGSGLSFTESYRDRGAL